MKALKVKTLQGDVHEVRCTDQSTVRDLKATIEQARPGASAYKILCKGKELGDDRTVAELALTEDSALYVVFKTKNAEAVAAAGAAASRAAERRTRPRVERVASQKRKLRSALSRGASFEVTGKLRHPEHTTPIANGGGGGGTVAVTVTLSSGKRVGSFDLKMTDTVIVLKQAIEQREKLSPGRQEVFFPCSDPAAGVAASTLDGFSGAWPGEMCEAPLCAWKDSLRAPSTLAQQLEACRGGAGGGTGLPPKAVGVYVVVRATAIGVSTLRVDSLALGFHDDGAAGLEIEKKHEHPGTDGAGAQGACGCCAVQ